MIIANPNCSTIQLVLHLNPLHQAIWRETSIVSTYQSVTGTGKAAVDQLEGERLAKMCIWFIPTRLTEIVFRIAMFFLTTITPKRK
jgi:aspartate-semialdehyde dehydrogenase